MSKNAHFTRSLAIASVLLAGAAAVQPSSAAASATSAAPAARILTIDMRSILLASKVGQSIQAQADQFKKQAQVTLNAEAEALKREKGEIEAQTAILNASVKAQKENAWKVRAMAFEKKVQERGGLIQGGMMKANQQVNDALSPILQGVMQERQATVLLDRSSILIAPNNIDVTQIVIQRLDTKMPAIKVELTPLPPGMAARQQAQAQ